MKTMFATNTPSATQIHPWPHQWPLNPAQIPPPSSSRIEM